MRHLKQQKRLYKVLIVVFLVLKLISDFGLSWKSLIVLVIEIVNSFAFVFKIIKSLFLSSKSLNVYFFFKGALFSILPPTLRSFRSETTSSLGVTRVRRDSRKTWPGNVLGDVSRSFLWFSQSFCQPHLLILLVRICFGRVIIWI